MAIGGRAPKGEYQNKSSVLSTRIRADTRRAMEEAAKRSGRSLSQEIEHRLRRSFDEDQKLIEIFGGRQIYAICRAISSVLAVEKERPGPENWLQDLSSYRRVLFAVVGVLDAMAPPPPPDWKDPWDNDPRGWMRAIDRLAGKDTAWPVLKGIADAGESLPAKNSKRDPSPYIRADLGEVAGRLKERVDYREQSLEKARKLKPTGGRKK